MKMLILFRPKLSTQKRYAIRTARYTAATKVLLAFEAPFWEREHGQVSIPIHSFRNSKKLGCNSKCIVPAAN